MECLLPYISMVTVPHIMVGSERMLDYRGVGIARFRSCGISKLPLQLTWMQPFFSAHSDFTLESEGLCSDLYRSLSLCLLAHE